MACPITQGGHKDEEVNGQWGKGGKGGSPAPRGAYPAIQNFCTSYPSGFNRQPVNRCSHQKRPFKWYVCRVNKIQATYTLVAQTELNPTLSLTTSADEQHSLFPVQLRRHENSAPTWTKYDTGNLI